MAINQRLIDKIQKLLSLAQSDNENEARMASAKANELLLKYNLDIQQVGNGEPEFIVESAGEGSSKLSMEARVLIPVIMDSFLVYAIISSKPEMNASGTRIRPMHYVKFVGERTNLVIATYTYTFLLRSLRDQFRAYVIKTGCNQRMRFSYYTGVANGLRQQFNTTKTEVESERGIVLRRDPRLDEFYKKMFPHTRARSGAAHEIDSQAYTDGVADGKSMRIHRGVTDKSGDALKLLK